MVIGEGKKNKNLWWCSVPEEDAKENQANEWDLQLKQKK